MEQQAVTSVDLDPAELALLRTALELLRSALGKEEADELEQVHRLLAKLSDKRS